MIYLSAEDVLLERFVLFITISGRKGRCMNDFATSKHELVVIGCVADLQRNAVIISFEEGLFAESKQIPSPITEQAFSRPATLEGPLEMNFDLRWDTVGGNGGPCLVRLTIAHPMTNFNAVLIQSPNDPGRWREDPLSVRRRVYPLSQVFDRTPLCAIPIRDIRVESAFDRIVVELGWEHKLEATGYAKLPRPITVAGIMAGPTNVSIEGPFEMRFDGTWCVYEFGDLKLPSLTVSFSFEHRRRHWQLVASPANPFVWLGTPAHSHKGRVRSFDAAFASAFDRLRENCNNWQQACS